MLDVFVIGVGGVGGALVDQIGRQQKWLKNKQIDLRVCGLFNSKHSVLNRDGIDLANWRDQIKQSDTDYTLNSIIDFAKNNRLLNPILVDCTSSSDVSDKYVDFLANGFMLDVFVIGVGGVGGALVDQIGRQQKWLKNKQIDLRVCGLFTSLLEVLNRDGINLDNWRDQIKQSETSYNLNGIIEFAKNNRLLNPILVDCTSSSDVSDKYVDFLANGFHVVTPNKKANTSSMAYYLRLRQEAANSKRKFQYDTNVGAGLPVIENLQNLLNAGDELIKFSGILSGSLSFIFGKLDEGMSLSEATKLAKEKGFTEPDPRDDLSGTDVARKLLILAREAGLQLELDQINVESVLPAEYSQGNIDEFMAKLPQLDAQFKEKSEKAAKEGKVLRYVANIDGDQCSVKIEAVDAEDPLYKVKNGENALAFYTRYYQPIPLVLRGYGAGNDVTAAGVFADILRTTSGKIGG